MRRSNALMFTAVLIALGLAVGCRSRGAGSMSSDRADSSGGPLAMGGAPTLDELRNATYGGFEEPRGPVTLTEGRWEGEPYVEGGAARPRVDFVRDFTLSGDLDGDGHEEAIVLLSQSSGGSGEYIFLAVVARKDSQLQNVATTLLGDRVQVRGARIEDGRILVDLVQAGRNDAACCPGELMSYGWTLESEGVLRRFEVTDQPGRLSLETIGDTEWVLRAWGWDEPAPAEPEVTLTVEDGRFNGRSGCNNYFAVAEPGDAPGEVSVGPVGSTRMACPEANMAVEDRFLGQLGGVKKLGFMATRLMLSFEKDGRWGVMLFDGREGS